MRVYVPVTLPGLAGWAKDGVPAPVAAHAVTPAVLEWYVGGDEEQLEFAVLLDAAQACLDLLAGDDGAPRRRAVVAVDVPATAVRPAPGEDRSAVLVGVALAASDIVSIHVDEPETAPTVAAAVQALPAARSGDDDAAFLLDEAEACDLLWYDVSELGDLLG